MLTALFAAATVYLLVTRPVPSPGEELSVVDAGGALETLGASPEQLERHYRSLLERDPANQPAAVRLGDLLFDQQRYLEAVDSYRKALEIKPADANVRTDMGIALLYLGRFREAVEAFDRAILDSPGHALAHYNLGVAPGSERRAGAGDSGTAEGAGPGGRRWGQRCPRRTPRP